MRKNTLFLVVVLCSVLLSGCRGEQDGIVTIKIYEPYQNQEFRLGSEDEEFCFSLKIEAPNPWVEVHLVDKGESPIPSWSGEVEPKKEEHICFTDSEAFRTIARDGAVEFLVFVTAWKPKTLDFYLWGWWRMYSRAVPENVNEPAVVRIKFIQQAPVMEGFETPIFKAGESARFQAFVRTPSRWLTFGVRAAHTGFFSKLFNSMRFEYKDAQYIEVGLLQKVEITGLPALEKGEKTVLIWAFEDAAENRSEYAIPVQAVAVDDEHLKLEQIEKAPTASTEAPELLRFYEDHDPIVHKIKYETGEGVEVKPDEDDAWNLACFGSALILIPLAGAAASAIKGD